MALDDGEVAVQLPGGHLDAILIPLLALRLNEALVEVLAQRLLDDRVPLQRFDGLVERSGKGGNPALAAPLLIEVVEVLLDGRWHREVPLDTIQAGGQHDGKGEVGIAARIGEAQLNPCRLWFGGGDARY